MNSSSLKKDKKHVEPCDDFINFNDSSFFENINIPDVDGSCIQINRTANSSALNVSALCCDEEISGYDRLSGKTWIYPTNYPVRDYQFNIIKATILKNTLVSLPTGLGKTFIAAVVMYNFYRWYPLGKIVFTAPTRPLVAQQIQACYNIVAIPKAHTIEMTGHMQVATRKMHWKDKRVFFATPQVIYNDLKSGTCPAELIRCLVFDEAHRARGNYAYCQIVSTLNNMKHFTYRVLALSATPGSKVDDVISVVKNLQIAHLELRTENCIDVSRYSHAKKIHTVVVPLGEQLNHLRQQYIEILDAYTRRLKQLNILSGNIGNLSKGRIIMLYKEFQSRERGARHPQHNNIMRDFTILISLYHGLELLARHGARVFLNFFDEHTEKTWMQSDDRLTVLLERLRDDLGVNPLALDRSTLPDGTVAPMPKNIRFGHPKFDRLREIMMKHFEEARQKGNETKAIVFCEYRESVHLVHCLLLQCRPLIQPQMFVGQGASGKDNVAVVSQKAQLRVMKQFRSGACNTLVATCVAEEGLDVGSVDLIICFDISTRSPVRLVQRCGRTGRERGGQVYILVTEGREHQTLQDCMRQRDNLTGKILQSSEVRNALYTRNPRMLPENITPECQKMHITVDNTEEKKGKKSGQKDLRSMLTNKTSNSSSITEQSGLITKEEYSNEFPDGIPRTDYFKESKEMWNLNLDTIKSSHRIYSSTNKSEWIEWQRTLQATTQIGHSGDTEILSELLLYADTKRFDLQPSKQLPDFNTQLLNQNTQIVVPPPPQPKKKVQNKKKPKLIVEQARTDGDIRALFSTTKKSTKEYTKVVQELGIENNTDIPTSLIDILVDLCLKDENTEIECDSCKIINCELLRKTDKQNNDVESLISIFSDNNLPNIALLDDIDLESINRLSNKFKGMHLINKTSEDIFSDEITTLNTPFCKVLMNNSTKPFKEQINLANQSTSNFDLELDFDFPDSDIEGRKSAENKSSANNFNVGGLDDIFADSDSLEDKSIEKNCSQTKDKEALEFFGLDSVEDIFADSNDDLEIIESSPTHTKYLNTGATFSKNSFPKPINIVRPCSPSLLTGTEVVNNTITSPILCSQVRQTKKNLVTSPVLCSQRNKLRNEKDITNENNSLLDNSKLLGRSFSIPKESSFFNCTPSSKSLLTITQVIDEINKPSYVNVSHDTKTVNNVDFNRSISPIICTQLSKPTSFSCTLKDTYNGPKTSTSPIISTRKNFSPTKNKITGKNNCSVVILDSDSDYTVNYNLSEKREEDKTDDVRKSIAKRKLDLTSDNLEYSSPFFNKRVKLNDNKLKMTLSLKEKIKSIFPNKNSQQDDSEIHIATSGSLIFGKENESPNKLVDTQLLNSRKTSTLIDDVLRVDFDDSPKIQNGVLEKLQMYRRNLRKSCEKTKYNKEASFCSQRNSRGNISSDSEDDFVTKDCVGEKLDKSASLPINYKVRKKRSNGGCEFLDLSAELSGSCDSGDELTDESQGSVAEFICDQTHHEQVDMQAHYLRSIRSPVTGKFKIPAMPSRVTDVLSQPLPDEDDDDYEIDSFCVDGNVGLTQAQEMCELELAEEKLRRRKKRRGRVRRVGDETKSDDSPVARPRQVARRKISSESE